MQIMTPVKRIITGIAMNVTAIGTRHRHAKTKPFILCFLEVLASICFLQSPFLC